MASFPCPKCGAKESTYQSHPVIAHERCCSACGEPLARGPFPVPVKSSNLDEIVTEEEKAHPTFSDPLLEAAYEVKMKAAMEYLTGPSCCMTPQAAEAAVKEHGPDSVLAGKALAESKPKTLSTDAVLPTARMARMSQSAPTSQDGGEPANPGDGDPAENELVPGTTTDFA